MTDDDTLRLWAGWRHRYLSELDATDSGTPINSDDVFVDILGQDLGTHLDRSE